jgi:hypothetical protein
MKNECPAFELLSRFADGALETARERELAAHLGGCPSCRATLSSLEEVDALLALTLPSAGARRFRLLRPAMIPVAAAILFGVTIGILLSMPSRVADSPIAVAEVSPQPFDGPSAMIPAEPVRNIYCQDQFSAPQLSPLWKTTEAISISNALVDAHGRRALSLTAHPGGRRRWALASTSGDFPVGEGVSFDVEYRVPRPAKGGRMQVLVQSSPAKAGRNVIRWSWTAEEELLEAQADGRGKPAILWSAKNAGSEGGWHRVKMVVTSQDVVLYRDGVESARKAHGLALERAGLTLGSTTDRRFKDLREPFECQVSDVVVRREPGQ